LTENARSLALDAAVETLVGGLLDRGARPPLALLLMGTGSGLLPGRLAHSVAVDLADLAELPEPWPRATVVSGELRGLPVWVVDDLGLDQPEDEQAPWARALPCWAAAAAGARVLLHVSAGTSLGGPAGIGAGHLALGRDHVNLSGTTPLRGLGTSRYGPLFPDQSRLHDRALRAAAQEHCRQLGLPCAEAVLAATCGPSLDTPAEQRYFAAAGADVAVQSLAAPLIAAAHAGMSALAIVAITDVAGERADLRRILERAERLAPAIEDLLLHLAPTALELAREFADFGAGAPRSQG
jgi:purine-nucleoside phosphorylase